MTEYIGKHRAPGYPQEWLPPGYDLYGRPICTCPLTVGDFPVPVADCRVHGHLVAWRWVTSSSSPVFTSSSVTAA